MGRTLIKISGLVLGLFLIVSGLAKFAAIGEFASAIVREFPMPRELGTACAFLIVGTEVFSGAGFYFRRTRRASGMVAAVLLGFFIILTFQKVIQGSEFECDCFGILAFQLSPGYHILLDCILISIAMSIASQPVSRRFSDSPGRRLPIAFLVPLLLGAIILVWALLSAFRAPAAVSAPEEKKLELNIAFPVKVDVARRGTLIKGITSTGLLRPVRMVELIPRVSGQITAVRAYEGKVVASGEILATIDQTEFKLAYERASVALLAAQIEYRTLSSSPFLQAVDSIQARRDLEAAREHFERVRTAYAAGRIDGPDFVRARREYEVARAYLLANREDVIANKSGLALAREAYERAKLDLDATEIRAPFSGQVAGWDAALGMQARAGHPLCSLADLSKILIDIDIVETEAGRVHPGENAVITCMAFPKVPIPGILRTVSPLVDLRTRMVRLAVELCLQRCPARVTVRPGMFASVLIETESLPKRLIVPREALLVRDLRQLVFTAERGEAKWHYVETGEENDHCVEVRSGIAEGDSVIVEGHHALAHDARIIVKN